MKTLPANCIESSDYGISGLLVQVLPINMQSVEEQLMMLPGVEVHLRDPAGRLVVTVEELPGQHLMTDSIRAIQDITGVLAASLVYAHSEPSEHIEE